MEEVFQELSVALGIPLPVVLSILALVMFLAFGLFVWMSVGSSWGLLFGVVPIAFGTLLGIFPVYLVLICLGLGVFIHFSNLLWSKNYSEEEKEDVEYGQEVHFEEEPHSKPHRKPPWTK